MIAGAAQRPGDLRRRVGAKAGDARIALEPHGFGVEGGFESARHGPEPREGELRQARVRPVERVHREVDGLEVLHFAVEPPALAEPGEVDVAVEERDARAVRAEPEILEVIGVAHVGEVRLKPQPVA